LSARLAGVFAPLTTPFDRDTGDVALDRLRGNTARLCADGLAGIVVGGSTGEAPLLELDELCRLVAAARDAAPAAAQVLAGTGAESTRRAVALTRAAAAAGTDAVLVRPPGYFAAGHTTATLAGYFRALADASPVPVLVYNIPKYTHLPLPPDLIHQLTDHANIVGVKDSSGDLKNLAAYRAAAPRWSVLVGSGAHLVAALEGGCDGGVVGIACFAADRCVALYRAFAAGDGGRAATLQRALAPLDQEIVGRLGPAGVKAAMDAVGDGLYGGPVRPPLAPLAAEDRDRVARLLAA
jgi:4-hydroxy-2-oxoglutarate aldolase